MASPKFHFRPEAEKDIKEVALYISGDSIDASRMFRVAVENSCEMLADFPGIGSVQEFEGKDTAGLRMFRIRKFEKYLIFYRATKNSLEIVRIIHGARDIPKLFGE